MSETTQRCGCCGGDLPARDIWEANRDRAGECDGSIEADTGRCRAYAADDLWEMPDPDDDLPDAWTR